MCSVSTVMIVQFFGWFLSLGESADANQIVLEAIRAPEFTRVGKSAAFTCSVSEGTNIVFSWTKDGIMLRDGPRIQIFNAKKTSMLNLEDVETSDRGEYTCVATNEVSEDRARTYLAVEERIVIDKLSSKFLKVGRSGTFTCSLIEGKSASFSWTKDGRLVSNSDRIQVLSTRRSSTLSFDEIETSDVGNYTCIASNSFSEDRSSAALEVEDRVRVETLASRRTSAGKRIGFMCTALEGDHVSFVWSRNGKVLLSGDRISIVSTGESSMLSIKHVHTADGGNYTCIASNPLSEDRTSAQLFVEGEIFLPDNLSLDRER
ncbi:fibroblast growth factor receptor-like [Galendromus occidentalis]|uniref:Fibroblast growth factor receptor-like n=1 Tax=Galendromus occidentalis TaxID=34638 RepID=A0AAJ7WJR9_9ACAR|nr:fibroblast growth factor receptor-like [Galendromus occidentalis]